MTPRFIDIGPQPGPQTAFMACEADVVLYGGAAGGGKTIGLLLDALRYGAVTPGWSGVIFRGKSKDLTGAGTIFEDARKLYAPTEADFREGAEVDVAWPGGGRLAFRHVQSSNLLDYQGQAFAWVGFDEATHFDISWIMYLLSRNRSTCGTRPSLRMTCNPDPDHPLASWVEPYLVQDKEDPAYGTPDRALAGRLRYFCIPEGGDDLVWGETAEEAAELGKRPVRFVKSFAFIDSKLDDNPALTSADPNYEANLAIQGSVREEQLRKGNWKVRPVSKGMLAQHRWNDVERPSIPTRLAWVRGWDKAGSEPSPEYTNPDYTVGVKLGFDERGDWYVVDVVMCRQEPGETASLMRATAIMDGPSCVQAIPKDPAQAGKVDVAFMRAKLRSPRVGRIEIDPTFANKGVRAQDLADSLEQGHGHIVIGDWVDREIQGAGDGPRTVGLAWWSQLEAFPIKSKKKIDAGDALATAYNIGHKLRPASRVSPRETAAKVAKSIAAGRRRGW